MNRNFFLKPAVIAFCFFLSLSFTSKAQYSVGVTGNYMIPSSEFGSAAKPGFGATVEIRKIFSDIIKAGINIGYASFENKNSDSKISPLIDGKTLTIIPVTLSAQVYFNDNKFRPFIGLDLGWATANLKLTTDAKNYFIMAPQLGVEYKLSEQVFIHLTAKDNLMFYERTAHASDLMSMVGINFGLTYKF
ncbi:MAG: OmpW family outer membrane protein [Bacteroidota bacterium]